MDELNRSAETFENLRPRLIGLAYRMLGTLAEAEDVVQEVYLRWHRTQEIEDPERWLVTVTTRLAIDHLRRAARRRETYPGPWLPEPVATDRTTPFDNVDLADHLSMAFLAVLERLSPPERAAFLLREVFDYDYSVLASMLDKSEVACRQLVSRARGRLRQERPRYDPDPEAHRRLAEEFVQAANTGDLGPFEHLLDQQVVLWSDGGGKALAALNPILGVDKVSRFFRGVLPKAPPGTTFEVRQVNGRAAVVGRLGEAILLTTSFELVEGRIKSLFMMRNPDKLQHLGGQ